MNVGENNVSFVDLESLSEPNNLYICNNEEYQSDDDDADAEEDCLDGILLKLFF